MPAKIYNGTNVLVLVDGVFEIDPDEPDRITMEVLQMPFCSEIKEGDGAYKMVEAIILGKNALDSVIGPIVTLSPTTGDGLQFKRFKRCKNK